MSSDKPFTKDNLDYYLKELAKEFRKLNGKAMKAEIILIGGASVVINYGFRDSTYDMDAVIHSSSAMKDAINHVGDKYNLPNGWLNTDFMKTSSYTSKISQFSKYYRTFSNILSVRTVTGEYLVAMKLMSGRKYKFDLSDIIGVLWDFEKEENPLSLEKIKIAVSNLYGSYDSLPEESRRFIESAIMNGNYEELYGKVRRMEADNKDILLQFQEEYPDVTTTDNVNDILESIRKKKESSDS